MAKTGADSGLGKWRTADWENGVLALDREKQFEVPKLTAEIMERLAGYTLVGFHVKGIR